VQVLKGDQDSPSDYLENIIAVSAGEQHSMALEKLDPNDPNCKGRLYTWGDNIYPPDPPGLYGKLGIGCDDSLSDTPGTVLSGEQDPCDTVALKNIVAVSAGWDHSMALEKYDPCDPFDPNFDPNYTTAHVYTWGYNGYGQLGDGSYQSRSTPVKVKSGQQDPNNNDSFLKDITAVSAGEAHCLALDVNGCLWAWGDNTEGQLGNGTNDPCTTPGRVLGLNGEGYLQNIVAISAGFWHCLAVDANGNVWTWGKNASFGNLGLGDITNKNTPHPVPIVRNITQQTAYFRIQRAIDDANDHDLLEASLGTFAESVDFLDKTITLRSTNPDDPAVVAATTIENRKTLLDYAVKFDNNPNSVLAGFTVTGASYGIRSTNTSSPQINNCIIRNNTEHGIYATNNSSLTITDSNIHTNGIQQIAGYGIYCNSSQANITNCVIQDNTSCGVYCENISSLTITDTTIQHNGDTITPSLLGDGIYCDDSDANVIHCFIHGNGRHNGSGIRCTGTSSVTVANSLIAVNKDHGIYSESPSILVIKNNWIHHNSYGIYFDPANSQALVRNNTIAHNAQYGIRASGTDPNITNCIIWGHTTGQLQNCTATYSCIQDGDTSNHNINSDPCFVDDPNDPNNYHLGTDSPCIDAGDPNFQDPNETDIDGEDRVIDGDGNGTATVDMGADEYYCSPADLYYDQIVNFLDFAIFASAWQTTSGDPNYKEDCDLADNNSIDYNDLDLFCADWLWQPAWTESYQSGFGRSMGAGSGLIESLASPAPDQKSQTTAEQPHLEQPDIEELLKWLDEFWLADEQLRKAIPEDEWLKFIEFIKSELK